MSHEKPILIFDVIETVFSLEALSRALQSEGLPAHAKDLFFAQLLRDAFATSATDTYIPFIDMARGNLQILLANFDVASPDAVVDRILPVFGQLEAHPDVKEALKLAKGKGLDVLFFTNGSESNTTALITRNNLGDLVDHVVSIESFQQWKPKNTAYQSAVQSVGGKPEHCAMIAAHAWDTFGAMNAGMLAGWVRRQDRIFHPAMTAPAAGSDNLVELVDELSERLLDSNKPN
ncbi:haloacid dehalogenase type II [Marinobacter sp. 1Y8]